MGLGTKDSFEGIKDDLGELAFECVGLVQNIGTLPVIKEGSIITEDFVTLEASDLKSAISGLNESVNLYTSKAILKEFESKYVSAKSDFIQTIGKSQDLCKGL